MSTPTVHRRLLIAAAACGFTGVLLGAFGAHGLKERLSAEMLAIYQTGVQYHLVHAIALLAVAIIAGAWPRSTSARIAGWLMVAGVVVFSGSLYALAITEHRWLGMITPVGGVAFLAGWAMLIVAAWRAPASGTHT